MPPPLYFALQKHPVMLRDTAREEYEILVDGIGRELIKLYKNEREAKNLLPFRVIELGFEPKTHSLEGCCSIQLSYGTIGSQRDRRTACGCKYTKSRPIINEFARNYTNRMQIEPRTEGGSQGSDDIPGPSVGDRTPPSPARRMVTGRRPHVPQTGPSEGSAPGKTYRTKKEAPGCGINRIPGSHA